MDSLTLESAFQNRRSEWNNVACLRSPPNHADRQFTALNIGTKKPEPTTAAKRNGLEDVVMLPLRTRSHHRRSRY